MQNYFIFLDLNTSSLLRQGSLGAQAQLPNGEESPLHPVTELEISSIIS